MKQLFGRDIEDVSIIGDVQEKCRKLKVWSKLFFLFNLNEPVQQNVEDL